MRDDVVCNFIAADDAINHLGLYIVGEVFIARTSGSKADNGVGCFAQSEES